MTPSSSTAKKELAAPDGCVPRVRLFADHVVVAKAAAFSGALEEARVPLMELSFEYGGVNAPARGASVRRDLTGHRDPEAEADARRVLERLGAVELACIDAVAAPTGSEAEYVVPPDGDRHSFCAFTSRALARWRALGWRVEVAADYPFHLIEREPVWSARVEPCADRPDWFAFELGVEVDGVRVDLLQVVLDLVDKVDVEEGLDALFASRRTSWTLRVSDTHHVSVPVERLRAVARVVAELYQGGPRPERVFPLSRLTALATFESALRRTNTHVTWRDPAGLTARARQRAAPLEPTAPPRGLQATLRTYQAEGLCFLQRLGKAGEGGVLADDMGLGKTLQAIAHIATELANGRLDAPALVVAPTTVVGNWARELARFAPALRVVVMHGPERRALWGQAAAAHVVITTYAVLVRDEARFAEAPFSAVILDEAQSIKNARCLARRSLEKLTAGHRVCLTGTPIENHLGELWSLFDWLMPGLLGDELSFRRFWRHPVEKQGSEERLASLRELVAPYVLRRLKRDVASELPPKTELWVPVELGGAQRELYESIRVAAHAEVRRAIRTKGIAASTLTILDALTKLRQVCCDPRLVPMDAASEVHESAKLDALVELVTRELAGGHRVLIFSQFTSMLALVGEALAARTIGFAALTGATRHRQRVVDRFEAGHAAVFLISLKAGGTGLNLTSADTVIHYDPWWNPASQAQATDRAHRIGQRRPVFVHNLYVAGSVEERVLLLQQRKRWLSTTLLGDPAAGALLGEGDLESLFAPIDPGPPA